MLRINLGLGSLGYVDHPLLIHRCFSSHDWEWTMNQQPLSVVSRTSRHFQPSILQNHHQMSTLVLDFVDDQIPDYERMSNKLFPLFQMKNTRTIIIGGVCKPGVDNVRGFYINSFEFQPSILTCSGQSSLILATFNCPI
jgi:hypothetical protein